MGLTPPRPRPEPEEDEEERDRTTPELQAAQHTEELQHDDEQAAARPSDDLNMTFARVQGTW